MLISRVPDESGGEVRGEERAREEAHHFQTANELFELMARDHDFEAAGEDTLTTRDLVLLYKNLDLGKQLISNISGVKGSPPNQYVETVVYQGARGSDTDLSECPSAEDLDNIIMVNNERIDLLINQTSNTLCHKFGDIEIKTSGFTADYDRHFSFKDPYIKEQLNNLKLMSASSELDSAVLPASLLDYICCKRLEDNYNFYMDNIIRYVKNTIEQLKRISNGDYLTERAKEKWKEVANHKEGGDNASKVLTTSTSIPLHVERKLTGLSTTWDDLVHSEVDLRSLAKILEKRIVVEVPKLISGSYKLFSKRRADNLVISCKRKEPPAPAPQSRVDVVFQLQRSDTGQVVSNIDSIMILNSDLPTVEDGAEKLRLMYEQKEEKEVTETPKIIELNDHEHLNEFCCPFSEIYDVDELDSQGYGTIDKEEALCEMEQVSTEPQHESIGERQSRTRSPRKPVSRLVRAAATNNIASPEDMRFTLQAIDRPLVEESVDASLTVKSKKKSPPRVRVKSPYENKSHVLEERKRKKLLEIRERREVKKMAMEDQSKVAKNPKYCKNAISPQPSSSVTKLSITNKSFYNSIFGQNFNMENAKQVPIAVLNNAKGRLGQKKDGAYPEIVIEQPEEEGVGREEDEEVARALKYIDRSYYLDDAETEMMYLEMKQGLTTSASASALSDDSGANLPHSATPSLSNIVGQVLPSNSMRSDRSPPDVIGERLKTSQSELNVVPADSVKASSPSHAESIDKTAPFIRCRRSIDKIYMLMNQGGKIDPGKAASKQKSRVGLADGPEGAAPGPERRAADSRPGRPGEPKVIISSKQRAKNDTCCKPDIEKLKKKGPLGPRAETFSDNPLKAISQLLHEFDHVQKTRQKSGADARPVKKEAGPAEERPARLDAIRRRSRGDAGRARPPAERPAPGPASPRARREPEPRAPRAGELLDEAREARGEAVRGPVFSARLQALAQPRRSYAPPRADELPRPARAQAERAQRPAAPGARPRSRRADPAAPPEPPPAASSSERAAKARRPASSSPEARAEARRADVRSADPRTPVAETLPQNLKKKMVAVESYVKVHYGRGTGPGPAARVPYLPNSELTSLSSSPVLQQSSAIGSKLQRMVESVLSRSAQAASRAPAAAPRVPSPPLRAAPPGPRAPPPGLCAPAAGPRDGPLSARAQPPGPRAPPPLLPAPTPAPSLHALPTPTRPSQLSPLLTLSQARREHSKDSLDFTVDVFSDKEIVTAVATPSPGQKLHTQLTKPTQLTNQTQQTQLHQQTQQTQHGPGTYNSIAELEMLENALYRRISQGSFPNRLRIKNLTLASKPSTQGIMVLQSGDSTSLVLKSKLSKIQINSSKSTSNEIGYQTLSTTHVDWRFSQMPVQIATVGYAFPNYEKDCGSNMIYQNNTDTDAFLTKKVYNESDSESWSPEERDRLEMTCRYFKGNQRQPGPECAVQATDADFSVSPARLQPVATTSTAAYASDHLTGKTAITTQLLDPDFTPTEKSETQISSSIGIDKDMSDRFIDYTSSLDMLVGLLNEIQKITSCAGAYKGSALDETSSDETAPGETAPGETASGETASGETAPGETAPDETASGETAPGETAPALTSVNTLCRTELDITRYGTTLYPTLDETGLASELKEAAPANNPGKSADMTAQVSTPDAAAQASSNVQPVSKSNLITLYEPKMVASSDVMLETEMKSVVSRCVGAPPPPARAAPPPPSLPPSPPSLPPSPPCLPPSPPSLPPSPPCLRVLAPGRGALPEPGGERSVLYSGAEIETSKVRLREIGTNPGTVKSLVLFHDNVVKDVKNVSVTCKSLMKKAGRKKKPSDNSVDTVVPEESGQAKRSLNKCVNATASDSMVRVKRDILVTVYSLLVLTVFAALSLPEMLLHQA